MATCLSRVNTISNYSIVTNFLSKDSLISGNALKAVKGADLTTEFTAVQTALNSKFDGATVFAPDGNATQPSFGFTNNAGTGMFNSAGVLGFATGATSRLTIAAAGNVIVNAPTSGVSQTINAAAVAGANDRAAVIAGTSTDVRLGIASTTSGNAQLNLDTIGVQNWAVGNVRSDGSFRISASQAVGTSDKLTISAAGAVTLASNLTATGGTSTFANVTAANCTLGAVGQLIFTPIGSGAAAQSVAQYFSDNNLYIDSPVTGTPAGGSTLLRTGIGSPTTRVTISSAGNITVAAPSAGTPVLFNRTGDGDSLVFARSGTNFLDIGSGANFLAGQAEMFTFGTIPLGLGTSGAAPVHLYANSALIATLTNGGGMQIGAPAGGDQGAGTLNATGLFINGVSVGSGATGTFTGTFTGGTTAPTVSCRYTKIGNSVTMRIIAGTTMLSNSNAFTITGLPAAIQPATGGVNTSGGVAVNNGANNAVVGQVTGGTLTFFVSTVGAFAATNFAPSGTKGIGDSTFVWDLN